MKFSISKEVFGQFKELSVGIIMAEDIENTEDSEEIEKLVSEITELVNDNFNPTNLANNRLISPWKSAYFDYEEKPHKTHSSVERLTKEAMENGEIERKNKLKDLCNFISLKYIAPVECFDLAKAQNEILLIRAKGDEFFYDPKLRKAVNPEEGEFIYTDRVNVLARKLDYTESDKAAVDKRTKKAVILVEGLKPLTKAKVRKITEEIAGLVEIFCKAKVKSFVLDKGKSSAEF
jgi:DNA/RNA-binding domain of Phe-tRNA-synthetase-like protein